MQNYVRKALSIKFDVRVPVGRREFLYKSYRQLLARSIVKIRFI